ncbi:peptidylprolyl isomerase [Flexithrix dorotheae]|uniref:peptidylprolyl isomerase n=1 Tax=Flexithrix dorotheae TaxID=70993 RepID=UPI0004778447|nr:peptidylprolyl isomerase [Flexithrix dorotheae]
MMRKIGMICFAISLALISCNTNEEKTTLAPLKEGEDYLITISTRLGDMKAVLYDQTPQHKANFVKLASEGFFDDLLFHRIIKDFMIQGGDPDSRNAGPDKMLGGGSPGYNIPAEFNQDLIHEKGALSAARKGDRINPKKESNGSQFFIVQGTPFSREELAVQNTDIKSLFALFDSLVNMEQFNDLNAQYGELQMDGDREKLFKFIWEQKGTIEKQFGAELEKPMTEKQKSTYTSVGGYPSLDGEYTVFGKVVSGLEVIDKIADVATQPGDRPVEDVKMEVKVEVLSKKEIMDTYGVEY